MINKKNKMGASNEKLDNEINQDKEIKNNTEVNLNNQNIKKNNKEMNLNTNEIINENYEIKNDNEIINTEQDDENEIPKLTPAGECPPKGTPIPKLEITNPQKPEDKKPPDLEKLK